MCRYCRCGATISPGRTSTTHPDFWMRQPSQQVPHVPWRTLSFSGFCPASHFTTLSSVIFLSHIPFLGALCRAESRATAGTAAAGGDRRRRPRGAFNSKIRRRRRPHPGGARGAGCAGRQGCRLEGMQPAALAQIVNLEKMLSGVFVVLAARMMLCSMARSLPGWSANVPFFCVNSDRACRHMAGCHAAQPVKRLAPTEFCCSRDSRQRTSASCWALSSCASAAEH